MGTKITIISWCRLFVCLYLIFQSAYLVLWLCSNKCRLMTYITLWKKRKGKSSSIILQTDAMEFTVRSNKRVCSIMYYLLAAHFELYVSLNCKKLQKYHYNHIAPVYYSSMELLEDNRRFFVSGNGLGKLNLNVIQRTISSFLANKQVQEMDIVFKKQYSMWIWERHSGEEPSHLLPGPFLASMNQPRDFTFIRNQVTTFLRLRKLYPYLIICCLISKLSACKEIKSNSCVVCVETSLIFLIIYYPRFI